MMSNNTKASHAPKQIPSLSFSRLTTVHPLLIFILLSCFLFIGCKHKFLHSGNIELKNFVQAWSDGRLESNAILQVQFVQAQDSIQIGQALNDCPLKIEPSVEGKCFWSDAHTLMFSPSQKWNSQKNYQVHILFKDIHKNIDHSNWDGFEFFFKVFPRSFSRQINWLEPKSLTSTISNESNSKYYSLTGEIWTSEAEKPADVEKILKITSYKAHFEHTNDSLHHKFTIDSIPRSAQKSELVLEFNGGALGQEQLNFSDTVQIPALGQFTSLGAVVREKKQRVLILPFSEILDQGQDLRGLIKLKRPENAGQTLSENVDEYGNLVPTANEFGDENMRFEIESSIIKVYLNNEWPEGDFQVHLSLGIRSAQGQVLKSDTLFNIQFAPEKPRLAFEEMGVLLPPSALSTIAVQAIHLDSIDVSVFQVYAQNIPQFLQENTLSGEGSLNRVGRFVGSKTYAIPSLNQGSWSRIALHLDSLLAKNPGDLYRIQVSFRPQHIHYSCPDGQKPKALPAPRPQSANNSESYSLNWSGPYENDEDLQGNEESSGYYDNWYENQNNPCHPAFYSQYSGHSKVERNILVASMGLSARLGTDHKLYATALSLDNAEFLKDVNFKVYNYQNMLLSEGKSAGDSATAITLPMQGVPHLLIAQKGNEVGYLKLAGGEALSVSDFDVGGVELFEGIRAYAYGERDVWRPGDSLFLSVVVEDHQSDAKNHPVKLDLRNSRGQKVWSGGPQKSAGRMHSFRIPTSPDAPTGTWLAKINAGSAKIEKTIRIEAIRPNRLKSSFVGLPPVLQSGQNLKVSLQSSWLHGAPARQLKASITAHLRSSTTSFKGLEKFSFDDPLKKWENVSVELWNGQLNEEGKADILANITQNTNAPGMLNAYLETKVFEPGGGYSVDLTTQKISPFVRYVGIQTPTGTQNSPFLSSGQNNPIQIALVNGLGQKLSGQVKIQVYKLDWKWWWDKNGERDANFLSQESKKPILENSMAVQSSNTVWNLNIRDQDWGRYLIRACDENGPHCSGTIVYIDWPSDQGNPKEAGRLSLTSQKSKYTVGEKALIQVPSPAAGRAWAVVAEGGRVVKSILVPVKAGINQIEIPITSEMAPGAYVDVLLIQSLKERSPDRPLRLHGVLPLEIYNPETQLEPQIAVAKQVAPLKNFGITISEKKGKAMNYTLAIVDEGLLNLTHFNTPEIWKSFNQRNAFKIKTWDLYDFVIDSRSGLFEHHLSVGGDGNGPPKGSERNQNRFPPIVQFYGPFKLEANHKTLHNIKLPEYMGQVRVMVVAADDQNAYGNTEAQVIVKAPLALIAEAPRTFAPNEEVQITITLFNDPQIRSAQIKIQSSGPIQSVKGNSINVNLGAQETTVLLPFRILNQTGNAQITITAQNGNNISTKTLNIPVLLRTSPITTWQDQFVKPGTSWSYQTTLSGVVNTNSAVLEVSSLPQINLQKRLNELLDYPYGCTEQTVSIALPQLYLANLTSLTEAQKSRIEKSIPMAIQTLRERQLTQGGFTLWPGQNHADNWASTWAGYFLIEAKEKGYFVPPHMLEAWANFETNLARADEGNLSTQSFRLFALAKLGKPEIGAMNRLIEKPLNITDKYLLAAAYQWVGNAKTAQKIIQNQNLFIAPYRDNEFTYGSEIRDYGIILECMRVLGQLQNSQNIVQKISGALSSTQWLSTQEVGWSLLALSKMVGHSQSGISVQNRLQNGSVQNFKISESILRIPLVQLGQSGTIQGTLQNLSARPLFVRLVSTQHPNAGEEKPLSTGLVLDVSYRNLKGEIVNPQKLKQGSDLVVWVSVTNPSNLTLPNIALHQFFPSGWEFSTLNALAPSADASLNFDYRDFRDNFAAFFFSLAPQKTIQFPLLFNASWPGHFYLPGAKVGSMYDGRLQALSAGMWVDVVP